MTNSKDYPSRAVGYIRLSTDKQASDDNEFEKQAKSIRKACERRGFNLLAIYEDVASGADPLGAVRREGLMDAVARAKADGAVLVISEPTRLFRNVEAARGFLATLDVPVFCARVGRFMKAPALIRAVARGETSVRSIRQGTVDAMARKKSEGVEFSNSDVRKKAAQASAKARALKSDEIAMQVANILQSDAAYRDLSHRALADLLNRRRILTGWKRPWTQNSVRDVRKKAEALILEMDQDYDDDVLNEPPVADKPIRADEVMKPLSKVHDVDDEQAELAKLPTYGLF